MKQPKLLIFHPARMPYRAGFFDQLAEEFPTKLVLTGEHGGKGVWKTLNRFRPDVVFVSEFGGIPLRVLLHRALTGRRYRVITMCDDSLPFVEGVGNFSRAHVWGRRWLAPKLDELILSDERVAKWFQARYGKGVWMPILHREPLAPQALEASARTIRERNLAGKRVFLYVGRFVPEKNIGLLLESYSLMRGEDTALVLVGDGPLRPQLEAQVRSLGMEADVCFESWQEPRDVARWYNIATALILPSRVEPFGAVVGEALDGGCRVLVSDQAGAACLVDPERNGALFSPEGPDAARNLAVLMRAERGVCPESLSQPRPSLALHSYAEGFGRVRKLLAPHVLFVLHLPPPKHGAAAIGEMLRDSQTIREAFEARFINLSTSDRMAHIGRLTPSKIGRFLAIRREVKRALRRFRPDLIYFTPTSRLPMLWKDFLIARSFLRKDIPLVLHLHNRGIGERSRAFPDRVIYKKLFRKAQVIAPSEAMWEEVRDFVPRERFHVCFNAAEDQGSAPIPHAEPTLLFLSNLLPSKGVETLLDTCAILKNRGIAFRLELVGSETAQIGRERLNEMISARGLEGCTDYRGPLDGEKKQAAYRGADGFVLPTREDLSPLVLMEAFSAGLPIVSSRVGGIPEIVSEGVTGFLCAGTDPEEWAAPLERLLRDEALRKRMGSAARQRYEKEFTPGALQQRVLTLLRQMI